MMCGARPVGFCLLPAVKKDARQQAARQQCGVPPAASPRHNAAVPVPVRFRILWALDGCLCCCGASARSALQKRGLEFAVAHSLLHRPQQPSVVPFFLLVCCGLTMSLVASMHSAVRKPARNDYNASTAHTPWRREDKPGDSSKRGEDIELCMLPELWVAFCLWQACVRSWRICTVVLCMLNRHRSPRAVPCSAR